MSEEIYYRQQAILDGLETPTDAILGAKKYLSGVADAFQTIFGESPTDQHLQDIEQAIAQLLPTHAVNYEH